MILSISGFLLGLFGLGLEYTSGLLVVYLVCGLRLDVLLGLRLEHTNRVLVVFWTGA